MYEMTFEQVNEVFEINVCNCHKYYLHKKLIIG